jgi:hypothetical protein
MRKKPWIRPMAAAFGLGLLMSSCATTDSNSTNQPPVAGNMDSLEMAKMAELQKIFFSIPSPMEMSSLIKDMGYQYDAKMLNSPENVSKYTGEVKQAVNLGIYGADLSFASMFDQKQESMNYLAAAQKLSRELGVDGALQDEIIERLNSNQDSRDSLLKIVSEAYGDLNGYLKENDRIEISALVVAGGWLEALYLSTAYSAGDNEVVKNRIAEQKYSLNNLIDYFSRFEGKDKLTEMKADLLVLKTLFDEVSAQSGKTEVKKESDGLVVIGNSSSVVMNDETLKKIATKVKEIRSKYIA